MHQARKRLPTMQNIICNPQRYRGQRMTGKLSDLSYCDLITLYKFHTGEWYAVPSEGKIYNRFHKELVGTLNDGYRIVGTTYHNVKLNVMVHRAVWIAVHGRTPEPHMQIDHLNGDKTDNRIENLMERTDKENKNNLATKWKKYGENNPNSKLSIEARIEINRAMKGAESVSPITRAKILKDLCSKYSITDTTVRTIAKEEII